VQRVELAGTGVQDFYVELPCRPKFAAALEVGGPLQLVQHIGR
jgi:hypothetical protein